MVGTPYHEWVNRLRPKPYENYVIFRRRVRMVSLATRRTITSGSTHPGYKEVEHSPVMENALCYLPFLKGPQ